MKKEKKTKETQEKPIAKLEQNPEITISSLSGLHSQPLKMLKEHLKTHIICKDYI